MFSTCGAAHDRHIEAERSTRPRRASRTAPASDAAVRHGRAVPVEDQRLEAPPQGFRQLCNIAHDPPAAIVTFSSPVCSTSVKLVAREPRAESPASRSPHPPAAAPGGSLQPVGQQRTLDRQRTGGCARPRSRASPAGAATAQPPPTPAGCMRPGMRPPRLAQSDRSRSRARVGAKSRALVATSNSAVRDCQHRLAGIRSA